MQNPTIAFDCQLAKPKLLPQSFNWDRRLDKSPCLQPGRENDVVLPFIQHSLSSQCDRLARILKSRPIDQPHIKVIAVDGPNPDLIKFMLRFLHFQITNYVGGMIRIYNDDWVRARMPDIQDMASYREYVTLWSTLWKYVIQAPLERVAGPIITNEFGGHQQTYLPCVNIIPFSPLTVSQRAAHSVPILDAYSDDEHWHWFAEFWRGQFKPNMIIYIEEHSNADVMRIKQQHMFILLVTTSKFDDSAMFTLNSKQLRRISFEVIEWLRQD